MNNVRWQEISISIILKAWLFGQLTIYALFHIIEEVRNDENNIEGRIGELSCMVSSADNNVGNYSFIIYGREYKKHKGFKHSNS